MFWLCSGELLGVHIFYSHWFQLIFLSVLRHGFSLGFHQEGYLVFKKTLTAQTELVNNKGQTKNGFANGKYRVVEIETF